MKVLIRMLILATCAAYLTSCAGLRKNTKNEETSHNILKLEIEGKEHWCTDAPTFKILLKEAYRD